MTLLLPAWASAATFTLTPTSLSFGTQVVITTSAARTITLTNTAASVLNLSLSSSNPEFAATSGCGGGVNPGATCTISITFRPGVAGPRTATLTVTDTASAANTASASLSGTGVTATTLSTTTLAFGSVVQGTTSAVKQVKLTNNQDVQLTGIVFTPSNPDYSVSGCGATLAARSTCTESVRFTPSAAAGTAENATLTITHGAVTSPQTVALTGTSAFPISLLPTTQLFTTTAQGATRTLLTLKLTNNQKIPLTNISYALTGPFSATGCTPPLGAGKSCTLAVTFAPTTANLGLVLGSLTVSSTDPSAWNRPSAALRGTAIVAVSVTPSPLIFGDVTVASTSAAKSLVIKNNLARSISLGATPFSIGGTAAADYTRTATTCGASLAAGASCSASLTFRPSQGGTRSARFSVASDAPGSPHSAALTGNGTTPITVSPTRLAFGNVGVGLVSAGQLVRLQNNQSVPATLNVNAPTGDFAKEDTSTTATTCGTSLPAGGSCTISVVMKPRVGGAASGGLTVLDPPFAALNVSLGGTGIRAVTTSVSSLTFAAQKVGTTSLSKQIIVTNHQTRPASLGVALTGNFAATDSCGGMVPALSTCVVSVTFTPLSAASLIGTVSFDDQVTSTGRVTVKLSGTGTTTDPSASIRSVSPGAGTVGTTVNNVEIIGSYTTFTSGAPTVSFGGGVTVSGVTVTSDTRLVVGGLTIAAGATPGARNVQVTNGATTASLSSGFVVSASAALSFSSITPDLGAQGQTLNVGIVGSNTHFAAGVTTANFGDNVLVNGAVQVIDATHAIANVTVSPTAVLGWRAVTVVTGGEYATLTPTGPDGPGFRVVASTATLAGVSPATGVQGDLPFVVTVSGVGTHFLQGASVVSFGSGINVGSVTVDTPTQLRVTISVTAVASPGVRDVTVTTGGERASRASAFTVTPSSTIPYLASVAPSGGQQGQTLTLTFTGVNTHFTTDAPRATLELGSNIAVGPVTVLNDTTITADVSIALVADVGARGGILSSGPTNYPFTFVVSPSSAAIISVSPSSAGQGTSLSVTVTGAGTHWTQSTTAAWFLPSSCPVPQIDRMTVNSATSAVLDITVPANACVGAAPFQMATGGEVVSAALGVYRLTPSLSLSPSSAMIGSTVTVNFLGEFTRFSSGAGPGPTSAVIDGTGVTLQNFTVLSPTSATAKFVVAPDAPAGSCYSASPGCHTVTLTTPLVSGSEILTAGFQVTSTPAVLVSIDPSHLAPGASALVSIRGSYTHFQTGVTTVGFGPNVSVSTPSVISPTELTVTVSVDSAAALGWRAAYVNTGDEQLTIGFRIDGPASPAIASVSPSSGAQGQSLSVTITGQNTNFSSASQLILGAGVTVADFTVTSPTTATAVVAVSSTAPIGPNAVVVLTPLAAGQEVASGAGFSVTRGPSQILSVSPSVATQSQVLNVAMVGEGTHWLPGGSTADFGSGVIVNTLTVADPTHATAQITILSTAPLGFHTVSMQTDGEYVSLTQGLNLQDATPILLSSSPNAGQQGTTFNVTVLAQQTHWQPGLTSASYGDGITVNSFTVLDSVSGVINVTINPLAYVESSPGCHNLTVTTGAEQVSLGSQLCVQPGAAVVRTVNPNASPRGQTLTVTVTGQNTRFTAGLTTADFGAGINTSNVTVTSATTATVDLAVTSSAPNGYHSVTMRTLGESATAAYAFTVGSGTATLNGAAPTSGQQGQTLTVRLIGQFTHWATGSTTVTLGPGIAVTGVSIVDATTADVSISIDPLASLGGRTVTVTTGGEIVSGNLFSVVAGPAIIASSAPVSGNQGQDIRLSLTGLNTHWAQGATQFSMSGVGLDIKLNYFLVQSATTAVAGITISPTASLGSRSIYMITGGESLVHANAFVVTGGIPAVASVSPGTGKPGDTGLNVQISGLYTNWNSTTTVDFGPGVTVQTRTVNNSTSITAVLGIDVAAGLGSRTVTVRTGAQALTGFFQVVSPTPPAPYISYMSPGSGLRGQTFTVSFAGQFTRWDPATSTVTFGDPGTSGITINSFQVTSQTSARANITIGMAAPLGARTVEIATGTELEQATFSVVVATPIVSIVDPSSAMQGATRDVNVIGQYTTFDATTVFDFGSGITVNSATILGPTIAQVNLTISILSPLGGRSVIATTGAEVAPSITGFSVTPSLAVVKSVTPNTAKQRDTLDVAVVGENTHWDSTTTFSLGGGIGVTNKIVTSPTTATLTITLAPLAALAGRTVTATTGGEVASLTNAFIVQPGTPLILSSAPASAQQQQNVSFTILGQFTQWDATTTVDYGSGVTISAVNVTSPTAITVSASIEWWALPGSRTLTVRTGSEVLALPGAFNVTNGPAAVSALNPASGGQGATLNVVVTGVNTHFTNGVTTGSFGAGISVNSVSVASLTAATVNVTIAANATPGQNSIALFTQGESAGAASAFTIVSTTPVIQYVTPSSAAQGSTLNVTVIGSLVNFNGTTTFDFGPGVTVNSKTIVSATEATVNITVSALAARTTRTVSATTGSVTASGANLLTVTAGPAYISAVNPVSGRQNRSGLLVTLSGNQTHFTAATPTVNLGSGVTVTNVSVTSDTSLTATVNISPSAPIQANDAVATTLGESAVLTGGFSVLAGLPTVTGAVPISARQNDRLDVVINGLYTNFVNGTTTASFGAGITVNSVVVSSQTQATVNITIQPAAAIGSRTVTMTTGAEVATGPGVFTVLAGEAQLDTVNPNTGAQGSAQTVTITGLYTHFQTGASAVTFSGGGVTAGTVTVNGPTQIQVPVTVTPGATDGARTVTVTTGSETVSKIGAFTVLPGLPAITVINPNVGVPNSSVTVSITGQFTNFVNGTTQARFGAGVGVNGGAEGAFGTVTVTSATTATATLAIGSSAVVGARDVRVQTGAEVLDVNAGFTVQTASPTAPGVTYISPANNSTGAPINTAITLQFSAPLDRTTVSANNIRVVDLTTQGHCVYDYSTKTPGTIGVDASGRIVTFTPAAVLAVGRGYTVCVNYGQVGTAASLKDPSGNQVAATYFYFTTGFAPDTSGPAFTASNIADGATGVPTNAPIVLGFTKPINPATVSAGASVTTGGSIVAGTLSYTADYRQLTFTPSSALPPATIYVVSLTTGLEDSVGNPLSNPGTVTFTTGAGSDVTPPVLVSSTPASGAVVGTEPTLRATFNEALNPLRETAAVVYIYNYGTGAVLQDGMVTLSADRKTITLVPARPLEPGTGYFWTLTAYDVSGNNLGYSQGFTTDAGVDVTPPAITSISPPPAATGIAVNAVVRVRFNEPIDPTAISLSATPAITFALSVSPDRRTLTFTPAGSLAASTAYSLTLSGVKDTSGNPMASSSWNFTTSAVADATGGTMSAVPTAGSTGVSPSSPIVLSLSEPADPTTVTSSSFRVYDNTAGQDVAGAVAASADLRTLTFTPNPGYAGGHQICTYASYFEYLRDFSGNPFNYLYNQCFTVATASDTTAPAVISVTPFDGATGIGYLNPITVTFSEPMRVASLAGGSVALFSGSTLVTTGYTAAPTGTSLTFNASLTYGTPYTVVIGTTVTDLAGNALPILFRSTFTTAPRPVTSRPQVVPPSRPQSGATNVNPSTAITFFLSQSIDPATVPGAIFVSQNGALLTGTATVSHGDRVITFTPSAPFARAALIQFWLTSDITDTAGNQLYDYQASFTAAPDLSAVGPAIVSYVPTYGAVVPYSSVIDVKLNKPVNPATVTASSFYMTTCTSTPVSTTRSLLQSNTVLRLRPTAPLTPGGCYYYYVTTGLTDTGGLPLTNSLPIGGGPGVSASYFTVNSTADTTSPSVLSVAPTNGASNIAANGIVRLTFSEPVQLVTIDPSTVTLTSGGSPIPYDVSSSVGSDGTMVVRLTPGIALPASSNVSVSVTSAVTDASGNAANPFTATFATAAGPDFSSPSVIASTVSTGDTAVPVTSVFTFTFDRPMDTRTFVSNSTIYLYDYTLGYLPHSLSFSADRTQVTFSPSAPLAVGRSFYIQTCSAQDLSGNSAGCFTVSFTTALFAPPGGPVVVQAIPYEGLTVPVNFKPAVRFDRPVSRPSISGVTLMAGATSLPFSASFTTGNTVVTIVPASILPANTAFTLTIAGVTDVGGQAMAAPTVVHFTTGPTLDLAAATVLAMTPPAYSTTGTNPVLRAWFSEPIDPIRATGGYLYNYSTGRFVPGFALSFNPSWTILTLSHAGTLAPYSHYLLCLPVLYDLAGNSSASPCQSFYTGPAADVSPLTVVSSTPPAAASGVPVNATISVRLNKRADPTSFGPSSGITFSPAVPGTQQLSSDGLTLTYVRSSALSPTTTYTMSVAGFADLNGNALTPFSSPFTTGAVSDTANGTISLTTPAPGSSSVAVTTQIVLTLNKAVNPLSVTPDAVVVYRDNIVRIAGSVSIGAGGTTLTFTPTSALPPGSSINVYGGYFTAPLYDLAGNSFGYLYNATFTTAAVADTTPPQVVSVSPVNGAANIGPIATVTLAFSETIDPATIDSRNFALYSGFTNLNAGVSRSADNRIVTLSTTLPYGATITVVVDTGVTDINGNPLASPFQSTFTTLPPELSASPSISQMRPGSGATGVPLDSLITLFATNPVYAPSLSGALAVVQDGVPISGSVSVTAGGYAVVFTPAVPFTPGALIQVFLTSSATDSEATPFAAFSQAFYAAQDFSGSPLQVTTYFPGYSTTQPTNTIVEIQFNKPIDPAYATSTYFYLTDSASSPVAASVTQVRPNVLRMIPSAALAGGTYYYFHAKPGLRAADGTTLGSSFDVYFYTASSPDTLLPVVTGVVPVDGATNIGDNATIRFTFNKVMDTASVNASTVTLRSAGVAVPFSLAFSSTAGGTTAVTLTPQAPLDDSSTIVLSLGTGIIDRTGQPIPAQTVTFHTGVGPDTTPPVLVDRSPDPRQVTGVPTNTQTYRWVFSEPLSPLSVGSNNDYVYPQATGVPLPATVALSADGKTLTVTLASPLNPSAAYVACAQNPADLSGNTGTSYCLGFTTGATASATGPLVIAANPLPGATGVARNAWVEAVFDKAIDATSLGAITLKKGAAGVAYTPTWSSYYFSGRALHLLPAALLDPNSSYTVTIAGVRDLAGLAMSTPYSFSFTTGPDLMLNGTTFTSATVLVGGVQTLLTTSGAVTGVSTSTPIQVTFSDAVMAASIMNNGARVIVTATSAVVPVSVTMSADGKTATVTPLSALAPTTQYQLQVNWVAAVYNQAGYQTSGGYNFNFTTGP